MLNQVDHQLEIGDSVERVIIPRDTFLHLYRRNKLILYLYLWSRDHKEENILGEFLTFVFDQLGEEEAYEVADELMDITSYRINESIRKIKELYD